MLKKLLSPAQSRAINSTADKILVLAGPGSGKTAVTVERICRLIDSGVPAAEIVAITFTNAAAKELQQRLLVNGHPEPLGFVGTIHAFMLFLLRKHGRVIALADKLTVIDGEQSKRVLKDTIKKQKWTGTQKEIEAELCKGPYSPRGARMNRAQIVASAYFQALQVNGLLDYQSILFYGWMLIETAALPPYQYLFVDEVQDSSHLFFKIFEGLPITNKFFVGDPDQSIYGFMGADVANILTLAETDGVEVIKLEGNYRSGVSICKAAQSLIEHNQTRVAKQTIPMREQRGGLASKPDFENSDDELYFVAQQIKQLDPNECAVLFRYNHEVNIAAKYFKYEGIELARNIEESKPDDWGRARMLVALFSNPYKHYLAADYIELRDGSAIRDMIAAQASRDFVCINKIHLKFPIDMPLNELTNRLSREEISPASVELVQQFTDELPQGSSIADLSLAIAGELGHKHEAGQGLTVTTIHSAKGREWKNVFLPAFNQSVIPGTKTGADLEEERRLAYVAVTRAKDMLFITAPKLRTPQFKYRMEPQEPSQFINELWKFGISV